MLESTPTNELEIGLGLKNKQRKEIMKFTIQSLEQQTIQTKYGPKQKYRFTSNGQTYDAWAKKGYTDQFKIGYSFEAELAGKPYKGIDSIQWPKAEGYGQPSTNPFAQGSSNTQLDRIESILKTIVEYISTIVSIDKNQKIFGQNISLSPPDMPFAGDPHPTSKDEPSPF